MNILRGSAEKEFGVKIISSTQMECAQIQWQKIVTGLPYWINEDTKTINFAKFLCKYTSKKVCLDLKVSIEGSERADYINKCIKNMIDKSIRDKVEDACALGGIILKPNGTYNAAGAIDYVMPGNFVITEKNSNGDILGIIFIDRIVKGNDYYTRLEYQHFADISIVSEDSAMENIRAYIIENKAYKSNNKDNLGRNIQLKNIPEWSGIEPQITISNINKPLFGYLKMPVNNIIDFNSPEGVSIFSDCIEELRDLDIAWSRKSSEIEDSQHITFIDETRIRVSDPKTRGLKKIKLPRFIQGLKQGVNESNTIDEHVATLLTTDRIADINSILSMISTKAGFSQGQFVLDRKNGNVTATEIESDDSETVETITDIRTALMTAVKDLIYALDKYCDIFFDMPSGYVNVLDETVADEDIFYFKDLLSTFEQDRLRAYQMVKDNMYTRKKYLIEYEGFSEKEADEMLAEIDAEQQKNMSHGLFDEE